MRSAYRGKRSIRWLQTQVLKAETTETGGFDPHRLLPNASTIGNGQINVRAISSATRGFRQQPGHVVKVTVKIEQLGDVIALIEAFDRHKVGAFIAVIAILLLLASAGACYWLLSTSHGGA